jgi:hypothetical protein
MSSINWIRGGAVMANVGTSIQNYLARVSKSAGTLHKKRMLALVNWFLEGRDISPRSLPFGDPKITSWLKKGFPLIVDMISTLRNSLRDELAVKILLGCTIGMEKWLINLYHTQYLATRDSSLEKQWQRLEKDCVVKLVRADYFRNLM